LVLLALLMQEGRTVLDQAGATLAAAAFGLNLLSPRLATLVRTDMMLSCFIFLIGWMIYRKLRDGAPWTAAERWAVFGFMTAALFTKGPVIYAFLLPGLVAFILIERKKRGLAWSGWWTWLMPLVLFLAWVGAGLMDKQFYDDVVIREFSSKFQEGVRDDERSQPIWFYFPHLLHKFAPWSVLLIALALCFPRVRRGMKPQVLWLVLWAMGGLLLMTLVPAKRVDRIFPVVPPLCLLVVEWCALLWNERRVRIGSSVAILAGMLFAGGYFLGLVPLSYRDGTPALVEFSQRVRELAHSRGIETITLPRARDEGLLLYFDLAKFADKSDAFDAWKAGKPMALVVSQRNLEAFRKEMGDVEPAFDSGKLTDKNEDRYYLFLRDKAGRTPE
ncbi:MAG: ArnT family glycosyltransferase, partial [Chthoniobacterales bacterium]